MTAKQISFLASLNINQLHRIHRRLWKPVVEAGGLTFGVDARTLNNPEWLVANSAIVSEIKRRQAA